jgi:hypothetical protein
VSKEAEQENTTRHASPGMGQETQYRTMPNKTCLISLLLVRVFGAEILHKFVLHRQKPKFLDAVLLRLRHTCTREHKSAIQWEIVCCHRRGNLSVRNAH